MADVSSQSNLPGFSEALQACLVEDAHVRTDARQLKIQLEEAQAAATQTRAGTALPGRLLAALGRGQGGPTSPEAAAEILAREKVLRRRYQESELVAQHYTRELDQHLHGYLFAHVPVYTMQSRARLQLAQWAGVITDLQADLRALIVALGQARNNAAAGYDRSTHKISFTALELFDQAGALITNVENRMKRANEEAAKLGGLPGVTMIPLRETVHGLTKLDMATMQLDADRLARELEDFERKQLFDLQGPAEQAAEAHVAQARAYLGQYREQLRAHCDGQTRPEDTAREMPGILDRFRRG
ncbi:MAG: hypothetical protein PSU94_12245 [Lacunisphaera sp.]|nr:hypothetical protein [Lacunisphaera sp.]